MLQSLLKSRYNASGIVFALYLLPVLALVVYNIDAQKSWYTLSLGLLAASAGTLALYSLLAKWQRAANSPPRIQPVEQPQQEAVHTNETHTQMLEEMHQLEKELEHFRDELAQVSQQKQDLLDEYQSYKESSQDDSENKKSMLNEYQETISEQRLVIEKKQNTIEELESKLKERDYELKTLLQLSDIGNDTPSAPSSQMAEPESIEEPAPPPPAAHETQVKTPEAASQLLKRCINAAQKITGASHFGNDAPLFRDFQINNYALDLRRLFDTLRSENSSTIIVFSPKENRVLFANQPVKSLLGWNPDKFAQDFFHLIEEGYDEWKEAARTTSQDEKRIRLLLKSRGGQSKLLHCHIKPIPTGLFRGHMIGVLFA